MASEKQMKMLERDTSRRSQLRNFEVSKHALREQIKKTRLSDEELYEQVRRELEYEQGGASFSVSNSHHRK